MKRLAGLSLFAILAIGVSLSAQDAAAPNPYYPLKVNSEWTYKVQGGPIKVKVIGTEKIKDNVTGYKLETSAGGKVSASEVVANTKEGVQRISVNGLIPAVPILFLKADAKKGDSWTVDTTVAGQEIKGNFKVEEAKINVGGKDYDTLYVKGENMKIGSTETTVEYWFAKDIGIVKLKFSLGTQDATLELESYMAGK